MIIKIENSVAHVPVESLSYSALFSLFLTQRATSYGHRSTNGSLQQHIIMWNIDNNGKTKDNTVGIIIHTRQLLLATTQLSIFFQSKCIVVTFILFPTTTFISMIRRDKTLRPCTFPTSNGLEWCYRNFLFRLYLIFVFFFHSCSS